MFQFAGRDEPIAKHLVAADVPRGEPGRRRLSWLWAIGIGVAILYGSLIPFDIHPTAFFLGETAPIFRLRFTFGGTEDIITNLLIYFPFGLALVLCGTGRSLSRWRNVPPALFAGAVLSVIAEMVQTATPSRVASWMDVVLNIMGTGMGAALGVVGGEITTRATLRLRQGLREQPLTIWATVLTIGLFLYGLVPFDFVTDTGGLHASFGRACLDLSTPRPAAFGDPPFALIMSQLGGAFWFAALGYLLAASQPASEHSPVAALCSAIKHGCILVVLVELTQLFTRSHSFDLATIVLRMLAIALGAWCATLWPQGQPVVYNTGRPGHIAPTGLLVALAGLQALVLVASTVQPDLWSLQAVSLDRIQWMPFQALWHGPMSTAFAKAVSTVVVYGVLALTLMIVFRRCGIRRYGLLSAMMATLLAGGVEVLHVLDVLRVADLTGPVLALFSALGARQLYELLSPASPSSASSM